MDDGPWMTGLIRSEDGAPRFFLPQKPLLLLLLLLLPLKLTALVMLAVLSSSDTTATTRRSGAGRGTALRNGVRRGLGPMTAAANEWILGAVANES